MMRLFFTTCLASLPLAALAETPVLTVLTHDSFASEWGPGPAVEAAFEEMCGCDLRFETGGDAAALLARLQLEGPQSATDVVLGLDTALSARAAETGLFAPHGVEAPTGLPIAHDDPLFLAYDWGWFGFVYDRTKLPEPPKNFAELAASDLQIAIQDPRSSTPGLGLLLWVDQIYGAEAGTIWDALSDNILTVTPGWTEAYGLFTAGEVDMVLSYTTSPAYHRISEGDLSKDWAPFDEGHYLQIEVAAVTARAPQPELARDFLAFSQSPAFQSLIATTNWMYPAQPIALPDGFETHRPALSLHATPEEAAARRAAALNLWQNSLAR